MSEMNFEQKNPDSTKTQNVENSDWDVGGIELAVLILGLSRSRIYQLVSKKLVPVHRIPGASKLYFSKRELLNHILTTNR
jgi:hypothetical protein